MNISDLTDPIIQRMSPEARKQLGVQTSGEASTAFVAKSERDLQNAIAGLLRIRGIAFQCSRMDRKTTGTVGWPDFTLALNGKPVAFEVKHGKGKLDAEQERCIALMKANGWHVYTVRTLDEARAILEEAL